MYQIKLSSLPNRLQTQVRSVLVNRVASADFPLSKLQSVDCKVIDRAVSDRTRVDWVYGSANSTYHEEAAKPGFEYTKVRAEKQFAECNEIIKEATTRLLKKIIQFERAALPEFSELGYEVRLGKFESVMPAPSWADYDFKQVVQITDTLRSPASQSIILTWGLREEVRVAARNWTTFYADGNGKNLSFAAVMLEFTERSHVDSLAKWDSWVDFRKQQMAAKASI